MNPGVRGFPGSAPNNLARQDGNPSGVAVDDDANVSGNGAGQATEIDSFTLKAAHNGKVIWANKGTAMTVTCPQDSNSLSVRPGFQCTVIQYGAGQVTFAKEGTDVLRSKNSNTKTAAQYSAVTVIKRASGEWALIGDLAA